MLVYQTLHARAFFHSSVWCCRVLKPALKMSNMLKYGSSCVYVNVIDPVLVFSSLSTVVCVGWIISEGKHNAVIDISSTRCFSSPTAARTGCARLNPDVEAPQRIVLSPPTNDCCPECFCLESGLWPRLEESRFLYMLPSWILTWCVDNCLCFDSLQFTLRWKVSLFTRPFVTPFAQNLLSCSQISFKLVHIQSCRIVIGYETPETQYDIFVCLEKKPTNLLFCWIII